MKTWDFIESQSKGKVVVEYEDYNDDRQFLFFNRFVDARLTAGRLFRLGMKQIHISDDDGYYV